MARQRRRHPYREQKRDADYETDSPRRRNRIYRSHTDHVCMGVLGGIAEHFDLPPWGVRLAFIILLVMGIGFPWLIILYFVMGFVLKPAPDRPFADYEEEEFWNKYQTSRSDALRKVHRAFESLDRRLQRMESVVTKPSFGLEDEYRDL